MEQLTEQAPVQVTEWIEEEITLAEFSERFLLSNDFTTPEVTDISHLGIEILSEDPILKGIQSGILGDSDPKVWKLIENFVVKPEVQFYYTDGKLNGTEEHRVVENGKEVYLKDHPDFKQVVGDLKVVDITVADTHTYWANGRLNHNTKFTPGGNALKFYASLRLKLLGKKYLTSLDQATGEEVPWGAEVTVRTDKNKLSIPMRKADFKLNFTRGIEEEQDWLTYLANVGVVSRGGSWYTITDKLGVPAFTNQKFQAPKWLGMLASDPALHAACKAAVIKAFIKTDTDNIAEAPIDEPELGDDIIADVETGEIVG